MTARTEHAVVIDAPLDLVWDMSNDVASWTGLFSEYARVEILDDDGVTTTFRLHTHPDEHGRAWSWVSRRVRDRAGLRVRAERVETGHFEFMHITWEYRQLPAGVELRWRQEFHLKDTAPVDDEFMARRITAGSAEQMARIKGLIELAARTGVGS
ncbi:SRPBCC family protein [Actinokineospora enzanensis]|uniref:SRPBCC family protein n=1 Tax=Actinokineospora enzanensis TaxID=155975 RepID=UPI00036B82A5|nr:SRPBCC family protein [Actinokineospora enzanensis]